VTTQPKIVILSGGAESVSLAVAESLWHQGLQYAVISIVRDSLLYSLPGCVSFTTIWSFGLDSKTAGRRLRACLQSIHNDVNNKLIVLPTEDDTLFLLNSCRDEIESVARFSTARYLQLGGLDKAELFQYLQERGFDELIVPTIEISCPDQAFKAMELFGNDAVFKPAFKPWSVTLGTSGAKVISQSDYYESPERIVQQLGEVWSLGDRWIVQQRMDTRSGAEKSACIVRGDRVGGCEVSEIYKYPSMGGSAVFVQSVSTRALMPFAEKIAIEIGLVGMCEMTFLPDSAGHPRLVELNTRPWLQIELIEKSGYPIVQETIRALQGLPLEADESQIEPHEWIQIERFVLGWLVGSMSPRWQSLKRVFKSIRSGAVFAIYSSKLPGVKARWVKKILRRLLMRFTPLKASK